MSRSRTVALVAASIAAFLLIAFVLAQLGGVLEMTVPMRAAKEAPAPEALEMELQSGALEGQEEAEVAEGAVADLDSERFDALSLPVYAERARFEGKEAWIALFLLLDRQDNRKILLKSLVFVADVGTDEVIYSSVRIRQ